jgi:hypothetical protein
VVRRRAADVVDLRRATTDLVRQVGQTPSDGPHIWVEPCMIVELMQSCWWFLANSIR